MALNADEIRELLREHVVDPELGINVVDLGLVYDIEIQGEKAVRVEMTLTTPGCPLYDVLEGEVRRVIQERYGDDVSVEVEFVFDPPWTPEMMSEEAKAELGFF